MKYYLITLLQIVLICSCTITKVDNVVDISTVSFSADQFVPGVFDMPETKVQINGTSIIWTAGDTLGVFPGTGAQVYFNTTAVGSTTTSFDGGGWGFKNSYLYYSYSPFIGDIYLDRRHIPVSYAVQVQNSIDDTDVGECCFMYTEATSAESGSLNFQYHQLGCVLRVRATLPAGTYTRLAVTAPTDVFTIEGYYDLMDATPSITPTRMGNQLSITLDNVVLDSETQIAVYMMTAPVDLMGTEITVSVLNSEKTEYQQKKTPSGAYVAGTVNGLTCNNMTAVPQSMGLLLEAWGDGGSISGTIE